MFHLYAFVLDKLSPNVRYGKIENNTELIVTPFKKEELTNGDKTTTEPQLNAITKSPTRDSTENRGTLYDRLFNKSSANKPEPMNKTIPSKPKQQSDDVKVIDSTTLDNVSVKSSFENDNDSSDSDVSNYDGNAQSFSSKSKPKSYTKKPSTNSKHANSSQPQKSKTVRLDVQSRLFDALFAELKNQDRKSYRFRAVPKKWAANTQMSDLLLTEHNTPDAFDKQLVYVLSCESLNENDERVAKEYYVNVKTTEESEEIPKNIFPSIEINDILMAHMKMQKYSRITLSTKKTVLNFVEKIELIPSISSSSFSLRDIEDSFKRLLIKNSHSMPMLINQEQLFKVCDGDALVMVKIYPESFRYCLCDGEILRENKIFVVEQRRDLSSILSNAEEVFTPKPDENSDSGGGFSANDCFIHLDEFDEIVNDCVASIVANNCLDEQNCLRKTNNYLITGMFNSSVCLKFW